MTPVFETLSGWEAPITEVRDYKKLPENARKYVERIAALAGIPVSIVSVGAGREQTIFNGEIF